MTAPLYIWDLLTARDGNLIQREAEPGEEVFRFIWGCGIPGDWRTEGVLLWQAAVWTGDMPSLVESMLVRVNP